MQPNHHIEFYHRNHFEYYYHRMIPEGRLAQFIDFFWETDFDTLWPQQPQGFTDLLFPNLGYTYFINLGTPFTMDLDDQSFGVKKDAFVPRYKNICTHHTPGNHIFGIKFSVSPVLFHKKIDFSEYTGYIFPLAYLIDPAVVEQIKIEDSFKKKVAVASAYYNNIIQQYAGSMKAVDTVTAVLRDNELHNRGDAVEAIAGRYGISSRTLQRYFEQTTGISTKPALQMLRIRKAIRAYIDEGPSFDCRSFGYYDYSHFFKQAGRFLQAHKAAAITSPVDLLTSRDEGVKY